jgi:hypothetical protein
MQIRQSLLKIACGDSTPWTREMQQAADAGFERQAVTLLSGQNHQRSTLAILVAWYLPAHRWRHVSGRPSGSQQHLIIFHILPQRRAQRRLRRLPHVQSLTSVASDWPGVADNPSSSTVVRGKDSQVCHSGHRMCSSLCPRNLGRASVLPVAFVRSPHAFMVEEECCLLNGVHCNKATQSRLVHAPLTSWAHGDCDGSRAQATARRVLTCSTGHSGAQASRHVHPITCPDR